MNAFDWIQKHFGKIILLFILTIVAALILAIYLNRGGRRETEIAIPDIFRDSTVVFDRSIVYVPWSETTTGFSPTLQRINREIVVSSSATKGEAGTIFKVTKAINVASYGLAAFDAGTTGVNYLVLQDEKGTQSFIPDFDYPNLDKPNPPLTYPANASVYKNNQKVGEVILGQ